MESEECVTAQQPVAVGAEEGTQDNDQIAAHQPGSMEVEYPPLSAQQPEPLDAEEVLRSAAQQQQPSVGNAAAPAEAQQQEPMAVPDGRPATAQHRDPAGSMWAASIVFRSLSAPPTLQTQPVHLPPLPQEAAQGSSTGSSSDWISNATEITYFSSSSDHSNHARHNGQLHINGSGGENGEGTSGALSEDADRAVEVGPSVSTDGASIQTAQPHGSGGSGPSSRKLSSVASTSSMSLSFSVTSSGSDPTKPNILESLRRSSLEIDEDEMENMACLTPLNNLVEAYSEYFEEVEPQQTEEYIMTVIKSYVELALTSTADIHTIAREVFDSCDDGKSTGRESPSQITDDEAEESESCASLEDRLQAVSDYVRTTSDDTTEEAVEEMIVEEYVAEMQMAESGILPEVGDAACHVASSTAVYNMEVQWGGELPAEKAYSDGDLASGDVKEVPKKVSAEETKCPIQITCASVKRAREADEDGKEPLSRTSSSSNSDRERMEHALASYFEKLYPETKRQRKVRMSQQKAAVLKIFSLAQARVCAIRNMNWVMLRCLKMVTTVVTQALEANRVAHRALLETTALRSAGVTGDFVAAMAEAATAASQCAETAVREIEEAVELHKMVVDALFLSERTLFNIKNENCEGADLVRHLFMGVELIEVQMIRACRTYLDKPKGRESLNSSRSSYSSRSTSPLVFSTSGGIHGPVVRRAFDSIEDGPSDVFQALMWACQSSVNAMEMLLKGLEDFSIAKSRKPRTSERK